MDSHGHRPRCVNGGDNGSDGPLRQSASHLRDRRGNVNQLTHPSIASCLGPTEIRESGQSWTNVVVLSSRTQCRQQAAVSIKEQWSVCVRVCVVCVCVNERESVCAAAGADQEEADRTNRI